MQYSELEKKIASAFFNFPRSKTVVKFIYQKLNYFFHKKSYTSRTKYDINRININDEESFFGYYGKSPLNQSNQYLLFHSSKHPTTLLPSNKFPIDIILYDMKNQNVLKKFPTFAYNWQQGSKLNWINNHTFVFNDYDKKNDRYIAKIIDANSKKNTHIIKYPIYDTHLNRAVSINFDRLNILSPDYGYRNKVNKTDILDSKNDGISLIDLEYGSSKILCSIDDVIDTHYTSSMDRAPHWINHVTFSPKGDKIIFLHRWGKNNKRYDSLILYNFRKNSITCISEGTMISHFSWIDNNQIVVYMQDKVLGLNYFHLNVSTKEKKVFHEQLLSKFGDGHPSFNSGLMIFDTYPNKSRMKELVLFDSNNNKMEIIGEFFEDFRYYKQTRCDLHPRWSFDSKNIFIDSVHEGKRYLYRIDMGVSKDEV